MHKDCQSVTSQPLRTVAHYTRMLLAGVDEQVNYLKPNDVGCITVISIISPSSFLLCILLYISL